MPLSTISYPLHPLHSGVFEKTLPLCEPLSCNPAAETALQVLIWCPESLSSQGLSSLEECFFTERNPGCRPGVRGPDRLWGARLNLKEFRVDGAS